MLANFLCMYLNAKENQIDILENKIYSSKNHLYASEIHPKNNVSRNIECKRGKTANVEWEVKTISQVCD